MSKGKEKHQAEQESGKAAQAPEKQAAGVKQPGETPAAEKPARETREIEELKDKLLRLMADFDNYRKRALREKTELYESANEALMLELLPVLDHFQLALKSAGEHDAPPALRDGFQIIYDQLLGTLAKFGLEPFDSEKQVFDYNLHEAIATIPSQTEPEGVIIAQNRKGYRLKGRVLRPAQVVVSSGKAAQPEQPGEKAAEE